VDQESLWSYYKKAENCPSGMGRYIQGESIALTKAMDILKSLEANQSITLEDWSRKSIDYANQFPNVSCKYRDALPRMLDLQRTGYVVIDGDVDTHDWKTIKVRITAKGFFSERGVYLFDRETDPEEPNHFGFKPDDFKS
jgi:hypothetical protein